MCVMPARCPQCSEPIMPAGAKFCPRCGTPVAPAPHASIDFGKMSAPVPPAGIVFLISLVLAPAAVVVGAALGIKLLVYVGIVLGIGLLILLVLGHFF